MLGSTGERSGNISVEAKQASFHDTLTHHQNNRLIVDENVHSPAM